MLVLHQDAVCGGGNGPDVDDRCSTEARGHPKKNSSSCGSLGRFYDFSITSTKSQQLPRRFNNLRRLAKSVGDEFKTFECECFRDQVLRVTREVLQERQIAVEVIPP